MGRRANSAIPLFTSCHPRPVGGASPTARYLVRTAVWRRGIVSPSREGGVDAEDFDVAVIGAGVLGTFHAYFACKKGLRTVLIERGGLPGEASVRNFGILFPSGMTAGPWHRRA